MYTLQFNSASYANRAAEYSLLQTLPKLVCYNQLQGSILQRLRMYKPILLFILLSVAISVAKANDAVEAAATGNITFENTPELVIQDETLTINKSSGKKLGDEMFGIDVDFHIKNISHHDVTRKIAFVLPPVQCQMDANSMWRGLDLTDQYEINNKGLKDFTTTVNNERQAYTTRMEAVIGKRNVTSLLNKLQIPLNPCKIQLSTEGKLDAKVSDNLRKYHLLTESNEAAWSQNIYFEWTQTFPAGKVINIHHHYTPVIGESVLSPRTVEELNGEFTRNKPIMTPMWNRNPNRLVHSNPSVLVINKELYPDSKQKRYCVMPKWVEYHLTTGAHWNGGIGTFKLIINDAAKAPFAVNKFYKHSDKVIKSMQDHSMHFTIKHFIPTQELLVLFISLPKSPEDLQACGL